jgi:ketosteroid isomerase-like protein
VRGDLIARAFAALDAGDTGPFEALLAPEARWVGVASSASETPTCDDRREVVDLLRRRVASGRRFAVRRAVESGDQVSVTLAVSGPGIPDGVTVTRVFTFRPGTNVVVRMDDGVDVLALRAQRDLADDGAPSSPDESA